MPLAQQQIETWRRRLHSKIPLLGGVLRRSALAGLVEHRHDVRVLPVLVEALDLPEPDLAQQARVALENLTEAEAADALCVLWSDTRDQRLGAILAAGGYVARKPVRVRVLSALQSNRAAELSPGGKEVIEALVRTLPDADEALARAAGLVLRGLTNPDGMDAFCALWAKDRNQRLGAILAASGYVARKPVQVRVLSALQAEKGAELLSDGKEVVEVLVQSLRAANLAQAAGTVLRSLTNPEGIDILCALWEKGRDLRLKQVIADGRYLARGPMRTRVLSALVCGRGAELLAEEEAAAELIAALSDAALGAAATAVLRGLGRTPAPIPGAARMVEALCEAAMRDPKSAAGRLCVEERYRPPDPERACLFLVVTRQFDAYFEEDHNFQALRPEYEAADKKIQRHVLDVVTSGDTRWRGFLGGRKPLAECSDEEIRVVFASWLRHQD